MPQQAVSCNLFFMGIILFSVTNETGGLCVNSYMCTSNDKVGLTLLSSVKKVTFFPRPLTLV